MKIAVLGTGTVGRALSGKLAELGHSVALGTRDPKVTADRPVDDETSWGAWLEWHPGITLATFADAAAAADLVIHAANGAGALTTLDAAGAENLAGKVLVDVSNPLDFSAGFPPTLFVANTSSLAERIQAAHPQARVVKTLNTMSAHIMVDPGALRREHSVFVSGDDAVAKTVVIGLLRDFGHTDVIDLGGLETARGPEMYLPLWLRLFGALGDANFNIHVVR